MATVTLAPRLKSSTFAIILWLFAAPIQHKIARQNAMDEMRSDQLGLLLAEVQHD
jgi:hypothetical protein